MREGLVGTLRVLGVLGLVLIVPFDLKNAIKDYRQMVRCWQHLSAILRWRLLMNIVLSVVTLALCVLCVVGRYLWLVLWMASLITFLTISLPCAKPRFNQKGWRAARNTVLFVLGCAAFVLGGVLFQLNW